MVVVTKESGSEIEELLKENDRDVEIKINVALGSKSNSSSSTATRSASINHIVINRGKYSTINILATHM